MARIDLPAVGLRPWSWRCCLALCAALLASGCMPQRMVKMSPAPGAVASFVKDSTQAGKYPASGAGELNIYSCRYGIAMQADAEFDPPKARMFELLLAEALPGIEGRNVVLHRFDLYDNQRLKLLAMAGSGMGGIIGHSIAASAHRASGSRFVLDRLIVHVDPDQGYVPEDENPIGCNGRGEGEYFASEISAGHSVLVTWLRFDVDGTQYHLRTFYQHQSESAVQLQDAKLDALRLSIHAAAEQIRTSGP